MVREKVSGWKISANDFTTHGGVPSKQNLDLLHFLNPWHHYPHLTARMNPSPASSPSLDTPFGNTESDLEVE